MRTTITLDDDVAFGLKRAMNSDPKKSFKTVLNDVIRKGLQPSDSKNNVPFVVRSRPIGIADKVNLDNIEEALNILEGSDRKW